MTTKPLPAKTELVDVYPNPTTGVFKAGLGKLWEWANAWGTADNCTITGGAINGTSVGGTTPAAGSFTTLAASGNVTLGDASTDTLNVGNGGIIKDAAGNVGFGVTPSAWSSSIKALESLSYSLSGATTAYGFLGNNTYVNAGGNWSYKVTAPAVLFEFGQEGYKWRIAPSGTAGNPIAFTQAMTLDANGNLLVGTTSGTKHVIQKGVSTGSNILDVIPSTGYGVYMCAGDSAGWSNANTVVFVAKNSTTGRSINAGGTINASGSDYAEYMLKATCWAGHKFAKGDIVGINSAGQLTPKFSDAVSFRVKTTNPSFVGGDDWFTEPRPEEPHAPNPELPAAPEVADADNLTEAEAKARAAWQAKCEQITAAAEQAYRLAKVDYLADLASFELRLEAARQNVERIMICGQVPVNVTGAKPGDWIVPVEGEDGMIVGVAVADDEITFAQHRRAVGQVIAIEADGRPRIIK